MAKRQTHKTNPGTPADAAFHELRSLMHHERLSPEQRTTVWRIARTLAKNDPDTFHNTTLPYLQAFPQHFAQPLARFSNLKALEKAANILPFARFELRLHRVDKPGNFILESLQKTPHKHCIGALWLNTRVLGDQGTRTLTNLLPSMRLTRLNLWQVHMGTQGLHALLQSDALSRLEHLNLGANHFGPAQLEAIAQCPHLASLTSLNLSHTGAQDDGLRAIASSPYLTKLQTLVMSDADLSDAGPQALALSTNITSLTLLNLSNNNISDTGATALANTPHLTSLRELWLDLNPITTSGIQALANAPNLTTLQRLSIDVDADGQRAIAHSPYLSPDIKAQFT